MRRDINTMTGQFDDLLVVNNINTPPKIIEMWMEEEVSLETVVILDSLTDFVYWEGKKITETLFWPDVSRKIKKYSPFVNFNREKCLNIVKKRFTLS